MPRWSHSRSIYGPVGGKGRLIIPSIPTLSLSTKTSNSISATITNYNALYSYNISSSAGTPSRSTNTVTVTGLKSGQSATIFVTAVNAGLSSPQASISDTTNVYAGVSFAATDGNVYLAVSTDYGSTWNAYFVSASATNAYRDLAFGDNKFVLTGTTLSQYIFNVVTNSVTSFNAPSPSAGLEGIGYINGKWCAITGAGGSPNNITYYMSTDLANWTTGTWPSWDSGTAPLRTIKNYQNTLVVAGAPNGRLYTSTDGTTFTRQSGTNSTASYDIAHNGTRWISRAVGANSTTFYSSDITTATWSTGNLANATTNHYFISAGPHGTVICAPYVNATTIKRSTDGISWSATSTTSQASGWGASVYLGNNCWLVSDGTRILYSSNDGVSWTAITSFGGKTINTSPAGLQGGVASSFPV